VTSCADGHATPLSLWRDCTVDCVTGADDCILCEQCLDGGVQVSPDTPLEVTWDGNTYAFGWTPQGCRCATATPAPAAHHRLRVPVFVSEQDALQGTPTWTQEVDFDLPAPGGVVEVLLGGYL
jgi:hypothetical protein